MSFLWNFLGTTIWRIMQNVPYTNSLKFFVTIIINYVEMWLFLDFKDWNIHKILFFCILTYCDEKLRDETLNWWNNTISYRKQNMAKLLAVDGDVEGKHGILWLFFSLFICFLVMNTLGFIFWRHLTCCDSFFGFIFGGVAIFTLSFWWMLIKENKFELGIRGGAFQQWRKNKYLESFCCRIGNGWCWDVFILINYLCLLVGKECLMWRIIFS